MSDVRSGRDRRKGGAALPLGLLAAVQTFVLFARRDRFAVLFWWTSESWLLVTLLWLKNLALAGAAFFVFYRLVRWTEALPDRPHPDGPGSRVRHVLLFAGILGAGMALRWVAPEQIPPGVWADSLFEAEGALRYPGSIPWIGGQPLQVEGLRNSALVSNLYLKFCGLLFRIFGRGDVGLLSLSAVGGTLALPAMYWLGREVAGRRRGLVAMAILAFGRWPLVFSRWAWTAALLLPLVLGAAAAAIRARRTGSAGWAAVAGLVLGLSLHTYVSAWAVAAGFALFAIGGLRRPAGVKLALAATAAALLAFAPFALAYLRYPERLGGRAHDVSFLAPTKDVAVPGGNRPGAPPLRLLYNAVEYTGLFLWTRDPNPRDGLTDRSPFDPLLGLAALVGAGIAIGKSRRGDFGQRIVLLLAATSLLAGILGNPGGAPNSLRVYPFVGAAVLWAAVCLDRWIPAAARRFPAPPALLWALGLSILFAAETIPFLAVWPESRVVAGSFCAAETAAGRLRRNLASAPTIVDPRAISWPIVFETLAAPPDPREGVPRLPRRNPMDLLTMPPGGAFWYVTTPDSLERLRKAGWRCSRGISLGEDLRDAVLSRVVPVGSAASAPERE